MLNPRFRARATRSGRLIVGGLLVGRDAEVECGAEVGHYETATILESWSNGRTGAARERVEAKGKAWARPLLFDAAGLARFKALREAGRLIRPCSGAHEELASSRRI